MKRNTTIFNLNQLVMRAFTLTALFVLSIGFGFAQLNGSYTINKNAAASSTNFTSFNAFRVALSVGQTGAVKVDVVAGSGPYSETVSFGTHSGSGYGTTINGNGNTLTGSSTYVLRFAGTDYVTVDNLTITNTTTYTTARCVWYHNSADYNTLKNCTITMPNISSNYAGSCYVGISQGTNSYSYGDPGQRNVIDNCTMYSRANYGPHSGVFIQEQNRYNYSVYSQTVKNCNIKDFYYAGIFGNYCSEVIATDNEIHNTGQRSHRAGTSRDKYGVRLYQYYKNAGNTKVNGNSIHHIDSSTYQGGYVYGIYCYPYYGRGNTFEFNDNDIDIHTNLGSTYGIYMSGYRNTISGTLSFNNNDIISKSAHTSSSYYCYSRGISVDMGYCYYIDWMDMKNNNIDVEANYYTQGIYLYAYYNRGYTRPGLVSNNIIRANSDGGTYGVYSSSRYANRGFDMVHNNITLNKWSRTGWSRNYDAYGFYGYYARGNKMNNNISILDSRGSGKRIYGIYYYYTNGAIFGSNNLYLNPTMPGNKRYGNYNRNDRTTFANWTAAAGSATTSKNENPSYVDMANWNWVPTNPNLVNSGRPYGTVPLDIDGVTRSTTTPDIGALEYTFDNAVSSVNLVGTSECAGYEETFTATVTNNNAFELPSLSADLFVDGVYKSSGTSTGAVAAGKSADITFTYKFIGSGTQNVEVRVPGDDIPGNNSASANIDVNPAPSGGSVVANSGSKGMHMLGAFDVTIVPNGIEYDLVHPNAFMDSEYGSKWDAKVATTFQSGTPVLTVDEATVTGASTGTPAKITFKPTSNVIDSLITLSITVTNVNTGCDTTIMRDVLIAPEGNPDWINPKINCLSDEVSFDNTSTVSTGTLTYSWDFGDGETSELTHPVHSYKAAGKYDVTLTTTTQPYEYKNSKTIQIEVKPVPVAGFTRVNACEGNDIILTNTSTGATNYNWNFGDINQADVQTKDATVQYTPGGYTVTLTAEEGGCEDTYSKTVYQFAVPVSSFTNTSGVCNTDEFTFNNTSTISDGSVGFSWDFDDNQNGNTNDISTVANPTYMFVNPGSHDVTLTAISEFGCEHKSIGRVRVKEGPAVSFTYGTTCSESATPFTNGTTYPSGWNVTYLWDFGDGSAINGDKDPTHNWTSTGDHNVTLTVKLDNDCEGSVTKAIKVLPQPVANFSVIDQCEGDVVSFENNSTWTEGDITFDWDYDGAITAANDAVSPTGVATMSGTYDVTLTAKVSEGCTNAVTKQLVVSDAPKSCQIVATPDHANGHNGYKFESSMDGTNPGTETDVTYYWTIENHGVHTGSNVNVDFQQEGDFTVKLTARNDKTGCECSSELNHNNVGIEDEVELGNKVLVYPNPASSKVFVKTTDVNARNMNVELFNIVGSKVISVNSNNVNNGIVELNISELPNGLYLVKVTSNGVQTTQKLTISK